MLGIIAAVLFVIAFILNAAKAGAAAGSGLTRTTL
jgi:hypothetical protein